MWVDRHSLFLYNHTVLCNLCKESIDESMPIFEYNPNFFESSESYAKSIHLTMASFIMHAKNKFNLQLERTDGFGDCLMPNNQHGLCVPLRKCSMLAHLANKKRLSIADRLFLLRSQCGYIGYMPLVCCPQSKEDHLVTRLSGSPFLIEDLPMDCGRVQANHSLPMDFIVGGKESRIFDSPWLALLKYTKCM